MPGLVAGIEHLIPSCDHNVPNGVRHAVRRPPSRTPKESGARQGMRLPVGTQSMTIGVGLPVSLQPFLQHDAKAISGTARTRDL